MKFFCDLGSCCSQSATAVGAPPPAAAVEDKKRSASVLPLLEHYCNQNGGRCNTKLLSRTTSVSSWQPALPAISEDSPVVLFAGGDVGNARGSVERGTTSSCVAKSKNSYCSPR
ncbi:hypothetical protein LINGRAHAP2_LOCUS18823 [Linum grandiflorum]